MDKTSGVFTSHKEMKSEEYRYWQSRPARERMAAISELTLAAYALRNGGKEPSNDAPRLQRPFVCLQTCTALSMLIRTYSHAPYLNGGV